MPLKGIGVYSGECRSVRLFLGLNAFSMTNLSGIIYVYIHI